MSGMPRLPGIFFFLYEVQIAKNSCFIIDIFFKAGFLYIALKSILELAL